MDLDNEAKRWSVSGSEACKAAARYLHDDERNPNTVRRNGRTTNAIVSTLSALFPHVPRCTQFHTNTEIAQFIPKNPNPIAGTMIPVLNRSKSDNGKTHVDWVELNTLKLTIANQLVMLPACVLKKMN